MFKRIVAALVGLAIVLPLLIWGGEPGIIGLVAVVLLIAFDEYARLTLPDVRGKALGVLVVGGLGVYAAMVFGLPGQAMPALVAAFLLTLASALLGMPDNERAAAFVWRVSAGLLYLPVLLAYIPLLRRLQHGLAWIFLVLAVTWLGDSVALFVGKAFGRHKLFERVSPKKTWEGAAGGMAGAVGAAAIVRQVGLPDLPWGHVVALAVVLELAAVGGDLVESTFKRAVGVKDSGRIMPGHGGILDRIDALLLSAPVCWLYVTGLGLG